jgi:predicted RND superfamily exporter protein
MPDVSEPASVRLLERWTDLVLRDARWWLAAVLIVTVGALTWLPRLEIDVSIESFLDPDDSDLALNSEMIDRFGSSVPLVVAYRDPELFSVPGLTRLDELTRRALATPYVARAHSLTTASVVTSTDDVLSVAAVADPLPTTNDEVARARKRALSQRRLVGNLISPDGTVPAVVINMVHVPGRSDEYAPGVVAAVRAAAKETLGPGTEVHLAGLSAYYQQMLQYAGRDLTVLTLVPFLVVLILLACLTRSLPGVLLPVGVVGITLLWVLGLMAALGVKLAIASILLPPLVLVVGCADAVHIVRQVQEEAARSADCDRATQIKRAMGPVGLAIVMTSATTCAGFASLTVSSLRPIWQFGLFAAIAVLIAMILSLTVVPIILYWWVPKPRGSAARPGWIDLALEGIGNLNHRRPRLVLVVWLLAAIGVGLGATRIRVETGFRDNFTDDSPVAKSLDFVQRHLTGPDVLLVYVESKGKDGVIAPEALEFVHTFAQELRAQRGVRHVESVVDLLDEMWRVWMGAEEGAFYLPATSAEAAQLLLLLEGDDDLLPALLTRQRDALKIVVRMDAIPTSQAAQIVANLKRRMAPLQPDGLSFRFTGPVYLGQRLVHEVIDSQLRSFGLAFLTIFILMAVALRSLQLALVSMLVNLLPVGIMLGLMGWLDIPLNDVTIMTASIAIGIAVDDTIHYLVRFRLEMRDRSGDRIAAMRRTVLSVGRAIVITSFVLAPGFALLMLASFKPPIFFGLLAFVTILVALAADLTVLPILLLMMPSRSVAATARGPST